MFFHWYQMVANPEAKVAPAWATKLSAWVPVPKAWPIMIHQRNCRFPRKKPSLDLTLLDKPQAENGDARQVSDQNRQVQPVKSCLHRYRPRFYLIPFFGMQFKTCAAMSNCKTLTSGCRTLRVRML